ncbi:MAG: exopolysaccharide biosynthesis polyprenyl glycosylphosphotransferase [Candidatus Paceibacterota bacterium]
MINSRKKESILLFVGDVFFFFFSLWLMLFIRYGAIPNASLFYDHASAFSLLFVVWIIVFFIAGLYEKHTLILRNKIPTIILNAQLINCGLAALFFYLIPYFGITPKTNLFIYLILSFLFILFWRIYGEMVFHVRHKQNAILIGSGSEMKELKQEVNNNPRYDLFFISSIDLEGVESLDFKDEVLEQIYSKDVQVIVADFKNHKLGPILPNLYNLVFSKIRFIDMNKIYEDIFDRIPLSLVTYSWFLESFSLDTKPVYNFFKRVMDIVAGFVLGIISLIFYPFVFLAIKMDDGGPLFSIQERVGQNNQPIKMFKFRTMTTANDGGKWGAGNENKVTRVGAFLRKSRIDELPQLWNILFGSISLIGPRPEFAQAVKQYEHDIPYYGVRHLLKPGLSGWAQIYHDEHPHHGVAIEQTKDKLSYDLFYLKNRSLILDIVIALKTIKKLILRVGV